MATAAGHSPRNADISATFQRQQERALELRSSTADERIAKIKKLLAAIASHESEIYSALHADFRKHEAEVDLTELMPVISEAKHTIAHLKKWMKPRKVRPTRAMVGTHSEIRCEPKGVSLIVAPWNYPVNLSLGPLVAAISAGDTAMLKPSELAPASAAVIRKIIEATFEPEEVAVFEGGVDVSTELLALPFDHIFFTGSPAVGKIVMAAAAKHLTSVTLELGGKSPTFIDQSANIKQAARFIVWGKFCNNGQTCITSDYILVHESIKQAFIDETIAAIKSCYGQTDNELKQSPDYCRIINDRNHTRLVNLLEDAKQRGARVCSGGVVDAGERFIAPTLLTDVPADAEIMHEEIFGPLLPIVSYDDIDDAIALVNSKPKPLALYIFGKEDATIEKIMARTTAGDTCINHNLLHFLHLNLPFGGVNNSGIGKSHGHYGFVAFSHERSVLRDGFTVFHWMFPPYTNRVKKLIKMAGKFLT